MATRTDDLPETMTFAEQQIKVLQRIARALEGIEDTLSDLADESQPDAAEETVGLNGVN